MAPKKRVSKAKKKVAKARVGVKKKPVSKSASAVKSAKKKSAKKPAVASKKPMGKSAKKSPSAVRVVSKKRAVSGAKASHKPNSVADLFRSLLQKKKQDPKSKPYQASPHSRQGKLIPHERTHAFSRFSGPRRRAA
jgi:hypothetical protein